MATQSSLTTPTLLSSLCQSLGIAMTDISNGSIRDVSTDTNTILSTGVERYILINIQIIGVLSCGAKVKLCMLKTDTNVKEVIHSFTKAGMGWSSGGRGWTW